MHRGGIDLEKAKKGGLGKPVAYQILRFAAQMLKNDQKVPFSGFFDEIRGFSRKAGFSGKLGDFQVNSWRILGILDAV